MGPIRCRPEGVRGLVVATSDHRYLCVRTWCQATRGRGPRHRSGHMSLGPYVSSYHRSGRALLPQRAANSAAAPFASVLLPHPVPGAGESAHSRSTVLGTSTPARANPTPWSSWGRGTTCRTLLGTRQRHIDAHPTRHPSRRSRCLPAPGVLLYARIDVERSVPNGEAANPDVSRGD